MGAGPKWTVWSDEEEGGRMQRQKDEIQKKKYTRQGSGRLLTMVVDACVYVFPLLCCMCVCLWVVCHTSPGPGSERNENDAKATLCRGDMGGLKIVHAASEGEAGGGGEKANPQIKTNPASHWHEGWKAGRGWMWKFPGSRWMWNFLIYFSIGFIIARGAIKNKFAFPSPCPRRAMRWTEARWKGTSRRQGKPMSSIRMAKDVEVGKKRGGGGRETEK